MLGRAFIVVSGVVPLGMTRYIRVVGNRPEGVLMSPRYGASGGHAQR
jgi:hypothetical protein